MRMDRPSSRIPANSLRMLCLALFLFFCSPLGLAPCFGQTQPDQTLEEQRGPYGYIDWSSMTAVATGVGIAPANMSNEHLARSMAGRAAVLDARRNLLEVIKGVRIDAETRVADFITQSDVIVSRVQGMLEGASIVRITPLGDDAWQALVSVRLTGGLGSYLFAAGDAAPLPPSTAQAMAGLEQRIARIEATLSPQPAHSAGDAALQNRLAAVERRLMELENQASRPQPSKPAPHAEPAPLKREPAVPAYTGLVIDARGLGFSPSLKPTLHHGSQQLYPGPDADMETASSRGFVRYFAELDQAQKSDTAGSRPLTIKASGLHRDDPGRLSVSAADARLLEALLALPDNPLDNCRLAVVF